jgi:hypothetical protein
MSLDLALRYVTWVVYLAMFLIVLRGARRTPTPGHRDVALFFAATTLLILLLGAETVLGAAPPRWIGVATTAVAMALPYLLLRLGPEQHGFFVEFDRGSMRPGRLRAKFVAYARCRASGHAARTYDGFPMLLLVTTGPGAEQRLVRALQAAEVGQWAPLPALLTTTALLQTVEGGLLGRVWRTAANPARRKAWE